MFRFTIRDVLWLTVVAGLVMGWAASSWAWSRKYEALRWKLIESEIDRQSMHYWWDGAQEVMDNAGIEWPIPALKNGVLVKPDGSE